MPNLAWTWDTLIAALQAWPRNASAAFVAQLPIIVGLGERRVWRELNLEEYDKRSTNLAMVTGVREVAKPTDVIQLRSVAFIVETTDEEENVFEDYRFLEQRSFEFCMLYAPRSSVQGEPIYYTELESGRILVVPTPDQDYPMAYRYISPPAESLSSSAPTVGTWLSRSVPDALFVACLMEGEHYLKADDRYADMRSKYYDELLPVARLELRGSMRSGDYSPMKPAAQLTG